LHLRTGAAAPLQPHFHVKLAAFAHRRDIDILVQHFDIAIGFDHAAGDDPGLIGAQIDGLGSITAQLEWNLLEVEDDVGGVFHHTRNRLELVQHAFDFDGGDGSSFNRTQQHAAQSVAHSSAEAAFKGLRPEDAVLIGKRGSINCKTFRFLKTLPKHCVLLRPFGSVLTP
jgi:hypothetical protein